MRIKEGFILRKIADVDIVVPIGNNIADFNGIISLNETAAFLWRLLKDGIEFARLVEQLAHEYQIPIETASEDTEEFLHQLQTANILENHG